MMAREIVEGKALLAFPVVENLTDYLEKTKIRLLSIDQEDGAFSAHIRAEASDVTFWFPEGRTLEVFVLSGSMLVNGSLVQEGHYIYLPPVSPKREVCIKTGSAVFFATGEVDVGSGEFAIIDPDTVPWEVRMSDCEFSDNGKSINVVKHLRVDSENRNNFGIDVMWPGGGLDCTEWHDVADEVFRLRGDLLLLDPLTGLPVESGPGSYAWRPLDSRHLPKYSHTGCVQIFRNREWPTGKVTTCYSVADKWPEYLQAYKAKFSVIEPIPGL